MRAAAAMAMCLAACGDNLHPVTIDEYPDAVREAQCRQRARCGEVESVEACLAINLGTVAFTASERAAIEAGTIVYDALAARACVDGLASQSCDVSTESFQRGPDACRAIAIGTRLAADTCAFDLECRSGSCGVPACNHACCIGSCVVDARPLPELDEACAPPQLCARGLTCDPSARRCVPLAPAGAACSAIFACGYGLLCIDNQCQTPPGLGQPCAGLCRDAGTHCSHASNTCVRGGLSGAACTIGSEVADCSPVYVCDRTGHCSAGIALGQPCGLGDRCAGVDAFCDVPLGDSTGQCARPMPDGAPCTRNAGCDSLYCDPFTLRCAPEPICRG